MWRMVKRLISIAYDEVQFISQTGKPAAILQQDLTLVCTRFLKNKYICFLYDYFKAVSSKAWPRKTEILEVL